MRGNPVVSVLGSAVAVFSGECIRQRGAKVDFPSAFAEERDGNKDHQRHYLQQQPRPLRRQTDVYISASRVQRVVFCNMLTL